MDTALVLAAVAPVVVRPTTPVLAAVGSCLGVHTHHVLLHLLVLGEPFSTNFAMESSLFVILSNVTLQVTTIAADFGTVWAYKSLVTVL